MVQLAPGGHLGRFIIWTKSAFDQLDSIFGKFHSQDLLHVASYTTAVDPDVIKLLGADRIYLTSCHACGEDCTGQHLRTTLYAVLEYGSGWFASRCF